MGEVRWGGGEVGGGFGLELSSAGRPPPHTYLKPRSHRSSTRLFTDHNSTSRLEMWDLGTGKLMESITWHQSAIHGESCALYAAQFSKSDKGRFIGAGGSGANEAKIFDRQQKNKCIGTVTGLTRGVFTLDFDPVAARVRIWLCAGVLLLSWCCTRVAGKLSHHHHLLLHFLPPHNNADVHRRRRRIHTCVRHCCAKGPQGERRGAVMESEINPFFNRPRPAAPSCLQIP